MINENIKKKKINKCHLYNRDIYSGFKPRLGKSINYKFTDKSVITLIN